MLWEILTGSTEWLNITLHRFFSAAVQFLTLSNFKKLELKYQPSAPELFGETSVKWYLAKIYENLWKWMKMPVFCWGYWMGDTSSPCHIPAYVWLQDCWDQISWWSQTIEHYYKLSLKCIEKCLQLNDSRKDLLSQPCWTQFSCHALSLTWQYKGWKLCCRRILDLQFFFNVSFSMLKLLQVFFKRKRKPVVWDMDKMKLQFTFWRCFLLTFWTLFLW